jgi:hypothetical protein
MPAAGYTMPWDTISDPGRYSVADKGPIQLGSVKSSGLPSAYDVASLASCVQVKYVIYARVQAGLDVLERDLGVAGWIIFS